MKNKGIFKAAKIITKIIEVCHWVGGALMAAATVCSLVAPGWVKYFVDLDVRGDVSELNVYGFEVAVSANGSSIDLRGFFLFGIGAVLLLGLMAMIFRNLHLILKKSEGNTPFQPENIRMVREIGFFSIAIPVISLVFSILYQVICHFAYGMDLVDTHINGAGIIVGLVVLCLSQVFVYGAELEKDVEGLL